MAASLITRSPSAITAARPRLVRDPMIRPGTKFLFDFSDARCHPAGTITPGPAPAGAVFSSLDTVPIPAIVVGSDIVINADGSLQFGGAGFVNQLRIGAAGQFNAAPSPFDELLLMTMKFPASGYTTTNFWSPFASGSDNNDSQGQVDMGNGGLTPRAVIGVPGSPASNLASSAGVAVVPGTVFQIGMRHDPGARLGLYKDGGLVSEIAASSVPAGLVDGAGKFYRLQSSGKFTAFRLALVDLDASIASETGYGLAPSDILTASQHVAEDLRFGRGTLTGAPKTPFS